MENNKEDYYSIADIFNKTRSFFSYVRRRFWVVLLFSSLGIGLGVYYHYRQKPKYEAVTTFILEEKSSGGGGLAGIASQFGFDIGSLSGGGSIFTGDNILDILKSKKIGYKVLLSKTDIKGEPYNQSLADLFLVFSGWKDKWRDAELKKINYSNYTDEHQLSVRQDSVLNEIHANVLKYGLKVDRLNKKGSIIKVQVTSSNSLFARLMTERLVEAAAKLYLDIKTGTALANVAKMQQRSDSLLYLLNRKSYAAAVSQPLDINPGIKSAIVPVEIATRDKTVLATLYAEVTKNLEASKMLLSQQTPIIQILDRPPYLLDDNKKSLSLILIISILLAGFICIICLSLSYFFSRINQKMKQLS